MNEHSAAPFTIHEDAQGDNGLSALPVQDVTEKTDEDRDSGRVALSPSKISSYFRVAKVQSHPEQSEPIEKPTPRIPRHAKPSPYTSLSTPSRKNAIPQTPRTSHTPASHSAGPSSIYSHARKIFSRGAATPTLVGRERERQDLESFLSSRLLSGNGGSMYISGPPGTGKSALAGDVCAGVRDQSDIRYGFLNCMTVKKPGDVWIHLADSLGIRLEIFKAGAGDSLWDAISRPNSPMFLVVLDEIDQMSGIDVDSLYSLFEWSHRPQSKLILLGIANALDLTDRFLPRLRARSIKPHLLPFMPYISTEIASILTSRARSLLPPESTVPQDFTPFIAPSAIQLVSKKVAAQTGDLRKAFDITQRAIDVVEAETSEKLQAQCKGSKDAESPRTPLAENTNLSSPSSSASKSKIKVPRTPQKHKHSELGRLTVENAPRATLAHIIRVTSAAFGNGTDWRLKSLNLQQKAILCSLAALEKKQQRTSPHNWPQSPMSTPTHVSKSKSSKLGTPSKSIEKSQTRASTSLRQLYDSYSELCSRENTLHSLSRTEFRDVVGNLETLSLVTPLTEKCKGSSFAAPWMSPAMPRKRGKSAGFGNQNMIDDRIIACSVDISELKNAVGSLESSILKRMLRDDDE